MRVEVSPQRTTLIPGQPVILTVQVFNSTQIISGHRVTVLGVDERWVSVDNGELSLFPDTSGMAIVTITLPPGIPAGTRRVAIQVNETTPPARTQVVEVDLTVPAELAVRVELDPMTATAGRAANFGVVVENTGNTDMDLSMAGTDEEARLKFLFEPSLLHLAPGERATTNLRLSGRRRLVGSPAVHPFTVRAEGGEGPVEAFGTFLQKPVLSRGAMSLVGLVVAVTVFAVVITAALSRVVTKSAADRDLILQVVQRGDATGGAAHPGSISGTVTQLTAGTGVSGVTVDVFDAANTAKAVGSTATNAAGAYRLAGLGDGTYKVRFRGAGFSELWFPQNLTPDAAKAVEVKQGQAVGDIDVRLGGIPGKITGRVTGEDVAGATVALELPAPGPVVSTGTGAPALVTGGTSDAAVVKTATVDASGAFVLEDVPSPSTYRLVAGKEGFTTEVQQVDLGGGEERTGIEIALRKGDGSIAGHISDVNGPLGAATITASDGHSTVTSVSLTQDDVGGFVLRNLPTPAVFTVLVSKQGYASQTLTLTLGSAQQLTGVGVTLSGGAGSVAGKVTTVDGKPAGGVTVTVTNGALTVQTATLSVGDIGTYQVNGLLLPSTYTVTFSRTDLADQTRSVDLDGLRVKDATGIDASMQTATATVFGTVSERDGGPLGEIDVVLTSGDATYKVRSATVPTLGQYEIDHVPPGTYSLSFNRKGTRATSTILVLTAGQRRQYDSVLDRPASVIGQVLTQTGNGLEPLPGADVRIYVATQFPTVRLATTVTDANGRFTFPDLDAPLTYIVEFAYPQGTPGQKTVQVTTTASQVSDVGATVVVTAQ